MKLQDIYKQYNYEPPMGDLTYISNVEIILDRISSYGFTGDIELTRKEFLTVFRALKDEILVSMLLGGKKMNDYFVDGIEVRGFLIKINDSTP